MKDIIIAQSFGRRFRLKALMTAAAMGTLVVGMPAAHAFDQQATGAQRDYALSLRAADQGYAYPSAFAQAPGYSAGPYNPYGPRLHAHRRHAE